MTKRSPEKLARLRELAATGMIAADIARDLGVSRVSVLSWAANEGIKLPNRLEAIRISNAKRGWPKRKPKKALGRKIVVPAWVPAQLRDEYRSITRDADEFVAANHIRKLKRATAPAHHQEA